MGKGSQGENRKTLKKRFMKKEIERLEQPVIVLKSRRLPTDVLDKL